MARRVLSMWVTGLLCAATLGAGVLAESVEVQVGFSSSVVASHYAPIWVHVADVDRPFEGIVRVTQQIGDPDAEPEPVLIDLYEGQIRAGTYAGTIPIYDPLNPVEVVLLDASQQVVAAGSVNLRLFQRTSRFPVVCGAPIRLGGLEIVVSPSELPSEWWAYEPVDSLWIAGAALPLPAWEAVARWVFAGGSLVVFTGEDYYQVESAVFRDLFPLAEPRIERTAEGTAYVRGSQSAAVETVLDANSEGTPLLYQTSFGSGTVSVVTFRASELSQEQLDAVGASIPRAALYSLLRFGSEYRDAMRVPRPIYMIAPSMVVILLGCVGFLRYAHRRQSLASRPASFGASLVGVLGVVVALSVWSGIYANNTKQLVELFSCRMTVQAHTPYGISLGYVGLLSPAMTREVSIDRTQVSVPSYALLKTSTQTSFGSTADLRAFRVTIHGNEVRDFRFFGTPRRLLSCQLDREEGRVAVSNNLFATLSSAFVMVDGRIYPLGEIPPGPSEGRLGDGRPWESVSFTSKYGGFLEAIIKEYRLDRGTWLLALSDGTESVPGTQVPAEVRVVELHVVQEGTS